MYRFCCVVLLCFIFSTHSWANVSSAEQVIALYGERVEFDVQRNGRSIGSHRVEFSEEQGMLRVDVEMDLHIRVLAVFSYRYLYQATEWWNDGKLEQLEVRVDDDGDVMQLSAILQGDQLKLVEGDDIRMLPSNLITTNHWNSAILTQESVLNTLTGETSSLSVEFLGDTTVPSGLEEVPVRLYRLGGELENTQTWYDDQGRWLGMEFSGRDDSRIRLIKRMMGG